MRGVHVVRILGGIRVRDGIALVVVAFADQPRKDPCRIVRVRNSRVDRRAGWHCFSFSIESGDIVLGNRSPMDVAVVGSRPAFDPREKTFSSWAITAYNILHVVNVPG